MNVIGDPKLERMLARLHDASDVEVTSVMAYYDAHVEEDGLPRPEDAGQLKEFLSDKFVALDRDKAEFCYQLCRATGARRIVEVGTSYGVSTLYLAAAVRDNVRVGGGPGVVIGTEYEPAKAKAARDNFAEAGLSEFVDVREGDLRDTLKHIDSPVDFVLVDIWFNMARPALELITPHLRAGAIVICDNTQQYRTTYASYFEFINDPANGFSTMTLPFVGGLEMSVHSKA
ncbi:MAG: O-methyltransferase [Candidatus Binataceae bacterium]